MADEINVSSSGQISLESMKKPLRADFIQTIISFDKDTHEAQFTIEPDPRRYDKTEKDGAILYVDKYLNTAFTLEVLLQGFKPGLPAYMLTPSVKSTTRYAKNRLKALNLELMGGVYTPPREKSVANYALNTGSSSKDIGFISVDICGSTALRSKNAPGFDRAYEIFLRELATVVGQFNGSILKATGDGFIAFIDHPSFTSLCDAIIDMGLSILHVLHKSINPALQEAALPSLDVRVGADYGSALVRKIAIPTTGFYSAEVASDALNRAVKIQESCEINEFRIGRSLYELIHVQWLERAEQVSFNGASVGLPNYQVYLIR